MKEGDRVKTMKDIIAYGYMGRPFVEVPAGTQGAINEIRDGRVYVLYDEDRFFKRFITTPYNLLIVAEATTPTNPS